MLDDVKEHAFTTLPVPADLADAYFTQRRSHEGDRLRSMSRQRNAAFIVGAAGVVVALMATYAVAALAPLKSVEPWVFVVDKATGIVDRNTDMTGSTITDVDAVNRYFANKYVQAREGWVWEELNTSAEEVSYLSTYEEAQRYQAMMKAPTGPANVYGRKAMVRVVVKSIWLLSPAKEEGKSGVMQVRFDRAEIRPGEDANAVFDEHRGCISPKPTTSCQTWSAKISFTYLKQGLPESVRLKNPLGWLVTDYHSNPEGQ